MTVLDGDPFKGFIRDRTVLRMLFKPKSPPIVEKYAESMAKTTGLSIEEVKRSRPFQRYKEALIV